MRNDSADDSLPPEFDVDELEEQLAATYRPEPQVEVIQPGDKLYGFGKVTVRGSQRMKGMAVTLSALDPYGSDFTAVIGGPECQAVFHRVPEGDYFVSAYVYFSQVSVVSGEEDTLVDWSQQRKERKATAYR